MTISMSGGTLLWIDNFLGSPARNLECPDGRALYAYRCTEQEFVLLRKTLKQTTLFDVGASEAVMRAFVFYASEWWQRRYDGGHWAWEPLLASIGWASVDYPDLYEPVRRAWSWWKVDLVRLPNSIRYLGTFACQGGLPLALVSDPGSKVRQYLRAVLRHTVAYRQFVEDPIDLARDQQHLLLPPTLRRDHVFRLAADLIESVIDLQTDAQGDDPLHTLDQVRPDWRRTMPLDLEDKRARDLLTGLLREAVQGHAVSVSDFRVERFLRQTGVGWRLGAKVRLPAVIDADRLARRLRVQEHDLPLRIEVRTKSERIVGIYAKHVDNDQFLLASNMRSSMELWDAEATREIRLRFLAKKEVGEPLVPQRGNALSDLPWSFRADDDGTLLGEGSISSRLPEIIVLAPDGATPVCLEVSVQLSPRQGDKVVSESETQVQKSNRVFWRIYEPVAFETSIGRCVIRPSSDQVAEEVYQLSGKRFYGFDSAVPLFRGIPRLRVAKGEQVPKNVPANEVQWRQVGGGWCQNHTGFGLWDLRHVRDGELQYCDRVGVLPKEMTLSIEPGFDMSQGYLVLHEAASVRVATCDEAVDVTTQIKGKSVRIQVASRDAIKPPVSVKILLHWHGANELAVQAPFPGQGGRFLRDGQPVEEEIAIDDLYGVRAIAFSSMETQRFWIHGKLKAEDLGSLKTIASFRQPLRKADVQHELPIVDLRQKIEILLASSLSSDASAVLRIVDQNQHEHDTVRVNRFASTLQFDPERNCIVYFPQISEDEKQTTFEAMRVGRPDLEPIPLDFIDPVNAPQKVSLPLDLNVDESRLLVVGHNDRVRIRPVAIGGKPASPNSPIGVNGAEKPCLQEAMNLSDLGPRMQAIGDAIDNMLKQGDTKCNEGEWSFITDSLLNSDGLPMTELDLLKVLVTKRKLLIRCLFRLDETTRNMLWRLEDELPFSWLLIPRELWWEEVKHAFEEAQKQLVGVLDEYDRVAYEYVTSILDEGADRISGLCTISADVALRLKGKKLSEETANTLIKKRDKKTPELISLHINMKNWPKGYSRHTWVKELDCKVPDSFWQNEDKLPVDKDIFPIFDTPVAAACLCFIAKIAKPTNRTTFLVKNMRAHDPEWFDLAYSAMWFYLANKADKIKKRD